MEGFLILNEYVDSTIVVEHNAFDSTIGLTGEFSDLAMWLGLNGANSAFIDLSVLFSFLLFAPGVAVSIGSIFLENNLLYFLRMLVVIIQLILNWPLIPVLVRVVELWIQLIFQAGFTYLRQVLVLNRDWFLHCELGVHLELRRWVLLRQVFVTLASLDFSEWFHQVINQ